MQVDRVKYQGCAIHSRARGIFTAVTRIQMPPGTPFNSNELCGFSLLPFQLRVFSRCLESSRDYYGIAHLKRANMDWFVVRQAHNGSELYISQLYK